MPDGDKVHENLAYRYQKPYKQLCEGQYGDAALAHEVLRPLKRDLQDYGAAPLTLLQQVATVLSQIPDEPLLKQFVDWGEKSQLIDRCAQQISGHRTAMERAVQACKQQLQELRSSSCPPDLTKEMYRKYVSAVYKANFEERVPLAQHYNSTDQGTVDARLQGMRVHVEQGEVADLIDLAVSVYVADRLSIRKPQRSRRIQVVVPVRHPDLLGSPQVSDRLSQILYWFTGDHWSFDFKRRTRSGRTAELQMTMPLANDFSEPSEVALWSGGLDSLAGLCNRLLADPSGCYTLLGTGSNTILHSTQRQVAVCLRGKFPGRIRLLQIPIRLDESTALRKEPSQRARGFVFMLLGAACASLAGKMTLHVYENGIGAINLPFRASEVGLDHTRSVHPLSLLSVSTLVTELLGARFSVENPFLFSTKAMMCQALVETGCVDLAFDTISCDRLHREKPMQCGYCSSCILRRQALAVHGIEDHTGYIATARPTESQAPWQLPLRLKPLKHITTARPVENQVSLWPTHAHRLAMLRQVEDLRAILRTRSPWDSLVHKYPRLADVVDQAAPYTGMAPEVMRERLIRLYQTYVCEWDSDSVRERVGEGLLSSARMQGAA